jgi:DNA-binding response OmpR family regulator
MGAINYVLIESRDGGMASIVIVEDNPDIAMLYERVLMGHNTHVFQNTDDAKIHLKTEKLDLAILDFNVPSEGGIAVLDYIRSQDRLKDTPVLGISADDMQKDNAKSKGITAFMTKPIDIDEMMLTVYKLLRPFA